MLGLILAIIAFAYVPFQVVVSDDGRLPDGTCPLGCRPANFYWAPTQTVVLYPEQSDRTVVHEVCHARQDWAVRQETGRAPTSDLREWYETWEGTIYAAGITALDAIPDYPMSALTALEDFANACAYYTLGMPLDPTRFDLMVQILGDK